MLYALPFLIIAFAASLPLFKNAVEKIESGSNKQLKYLYDFFILVIFVISLIFLRGEKFNPFIYFRF
jgi:uncharacterized membrane protein YtjA (UPF0391 family)